MFIGHIHVQADFVCVVNSDGTILSQDYKSSSTSDYRWEGYTDPDTTYIKAYSIKGGTYKYIVEPNYTTTPTTVTVAAGQIIAQCYGESQSLIIWEI